MLVLIDKVVVANWLQSHWRRHFFFCAPFFLFFIPVRDYTMHQISHPLLTSKHAPVILLLLAVNKQTRLQSVKVSFPFFFTPLHKNGGEKSFFFLPKGQKRQVEVWQSSPPPTEKLYSCCALLHLQLMNYSNAKRAESERGGRQRPIQSATTASVLFCVQALGTFK